ncbi:unnamed protein product [Aureobasidium uvarum]|uniref:Uncharacterized protein n=1 Tax=Aureobasidium uvarum TaxID=2773716 RepID=A0A9N8KKP5_9PEZI|nr:unnamed protein product [Aureobasidium uvarum]
MSNGKEEPQVNTVQLDNEEQAFPDPQWRTGLRARFPWNGFIALLIVILCANSSIIVLLVSDGKRQLHWAQKIGPSVLLSGFNGIANIAFGVAIANGVAITWWRKALRGATIKELHRSWQYSSSIKDILLYGRYFNFIALAALAAKLTIIDGILLQKAAGTTLQSDKARNVTIDVYVNNSMPYTGIVADESGNVALAQWFSANVHNWSRTGGLFPPDVNSQPCNGTCTYKIQGTGFAVDCQSEQLEMDYGASVSQQAVTPSQNNTSSSLNVNRTLFDVTFQPLYGGAGVDDYYSRIEMNLTFSNATALEGNSTSCPGTLTRRNCILRPAIIDYPVTVEDNTYSDSVPYVSNMYLGYNTTIIGGLLNNYSLVTYKDILEDPSFLPEGSATVIGGIAKVLNEYFAGTSKMRYEAGQFVVDETGAAGVSPFDYFRNDSAGCDFEYQDPLDYTIRQINSLMFTLSNDPWYLNSDNNHSLTTPIRATEYGTSIHYRTNRNFMYGAMGSILFCVFCVLPSYWGYWQLGRDVTLGPFEIANAFRAPILDHPTVANAPVKQLIREVGQREVKYGAMVQGDASNRLAIAEPDAVRRVHPSIHDRRM